MTRSTFSAARLSCGVATLLMVGGGLALVNSEPAFALSCGHGWSPNNAGNGSVVTTEADLRTGPDSSCGLKLTLGKGTDLHFNCFVQNESGAYWARVNLKGSPNFDTGWVRVDNLTGDNPTKPGSAC
jgi:hypothetical protein